MRKTHVHLAAFCRSLLGASFVWFCLSATAFAQYADVSPWIGAYKNAAPEKAKNVIEKAINDTTESMGMIRKRVARSRLKDTNRPYKMVRISSRADQEIVTDFDGVRYQAPADGSPERGTDPQGKVVSVTFRPEGRTLRGRFVAEDGEKRFGFELSPDGRELTVHVTVLSSKLPGPLRYQMHYTRQ